MEKVNGVQTWVTEKEIAAARYFEVEREEVEAISESGIFFLVDGAEYMIVTEKERDEELKHNFEAMAWAFNPEFLADMTELDIEVFEALTKIDESGNDAILKLIEKTCGLDDFISEAVRYDGAGHFLSPYDGVEHGILDDNFNILYYAYRTN